MFASLRHFIGWMISAFGSRRDLVLENLALRQQLLALRASVRRASGFVQIPIALKTPP